MSNQDTDTGRASGGYQPDPAAEVQMTIDAFFEAVIASFPDKPDLAARLRGRQRDLLSKQQEWVSDEPSRHNLAMTLAVLAAYQELAPERSDEELVPLLQSAFVEPLRPYVHQATRAALDSVPDPFAEMVRVSRDREQLAFGAGFTFSHPEDDHNRYTAQVDRCYYHDVLRANRAAQLTPIFCAFDANWIDAIQPARDGIEFDRPSTIGTGGTSCPFRFRRTRRTGLDRSPRRLR